MPGAIGLIAALSCKDGNGATARAVAAAHPVARAGIRTCIAWSRFDPRAFRLRARSLNRHAY